MLELPVYLDYAATTPVDPRVVARMLPYLGQHFGNPASRSHRIGWVAEEAVVEAADLDAQLASALAQTTLRDAVAAVAEATGLPRRQVYQRALALGRDG